jgi:2',3'-cyclic-nucleotide 2'-phosphodiesterase/3'-nucleotidase
MLKYLPCLLLLLSSAAFAEKKTITVLATTDLHGNLLPYDYFTSKPAQRGLAKIATLVRKARIDNPDTLLVDCGDTIQGTPLESVYQHGPRILPDPMMAAMNLMKYDAMVVGNHEFNFGLKNFEQARRSAKFPWISANIEPGFAPYVVKEVGGLKVAIVGITTPAVPSWEKPENYAGFRFRPGVEAAREAVEEVRRKFNPRIVIVAAHAGFESEGQAPGENMIGEIARTVKGVDAIVFGHTHRELAEQRIGDVLLVQPRNWGMSLARLDFEFEDEKLIAKRSGVIKVTAETVADAEIVALAKPYHEAAEKYLNTPVAEAPVAMDARTSRVTDSAIIDLIQEVQLHYAHADVSFASAFNMNLRIAKGPVTVRELAALYLYDNELYAIEGTGKMVKDALENAARFFGNPSVMGFNYDMAQGVNYEIDVTRPEGDRIRNLSYRGKPLSPTQKLRIAVNNYRAGGSGGYDMFRGANVVWRGGEEIREMIIRYYTEKKRLPAAPDDNWRIVPPAAAEELLKKALSRQE